MPSMKRGAFPDLCLLAVLRIGQGFWRNHWPQTVIYPNLGLTPLGEEGLEARVAFLGSAVRTDQGAVADGAAPIGQVPPGDRIQPGLAVGHRIELLGPVSLGGFGELIP